MCVVVGGMFMHLSARGDPGHCTTISHERIFSVRYIFCPFSCRLCHPKGFLDPQPWKRRADSSSLPHPQDPAALHPIFPSFLSPAYSPFPVILAPSPSPSHTWPHPASPVPSPWHTKPCPPPLGHHSSCAHPYSPIPSYTHPYPPNKNPSPHPIHLPYQSLGFLTLSQLLHSPFAPVSLPCHRSISCLLAAAQAPWLQEVMPLRQMCWSTCIR